MPSSDRPLSVLHLTAGSDAGGVSRYLFDLCSAMKSQGHDVAIAGERGAWHNLFESAPFPWIEMPLKGGPFALLRCQKILEKYLAEHRVDVLHTHYRRASLVARRVAKQAGIPLLFTLHLTELSVGGWRRWLTDFGDHTHVASLDARDWLITQAHLPPEQITVIPHGIDPSRFPLSTPEDKLVARAVLCLPASATVAAFVGRFDKPKNEHWLLDLAEKSRQTLPNLVVVMMGQGPHLAKLQNRIARKNLSQRVRLLPYGDPLPLYRAADMLLLPSAREGFSLVCAEAMSTGRPVLRTRTAGTRELIIEGVTGWSVPVDHQEFLDTATRLLADPATLQSVGQTASQHIVSQLNWHLQLQRTIDFYRTLARGK